MGTDTIKLVRLLSIIQLLTAVFPEKSAYRLAAFLSEHFSPDKNHPAIHKIRNVLFVSHTDAENIWKRHLQLQGAFYADGFLFRDRDRLWVDNHVDIENGHLLNELKQSGGLLLTWHTQHHHLLTVTLGLLGLPVYLLALSPEDGVSDKRLRKFVDLLHENSEKHFSGTYLFFRINSKSSRNYFRVLKQNKVLISLNDNHSNAGRSIDVSLLRRKLKIMHGTVDIALRMHKPVFAALMFRHGQRYQIKLKKLDTALDKQALMQSYMDMLEQQLYELPELWEGWRWLP